MSGFGRTITAGAAAGAAGTTALNAITYLDMAVRARPASSTPEESARRLADTVGVEIPGNDEQRSNRLGGLGPLLGLAAGVGSGVVVALVWSAGWRPGRTTGSLAAAAVALAAGNAPMTILKVTDPRTWTPTDWVSDIVPHLAYGVVTDAVLRGLFRDA